MKPFTKFALAAALLLGAAAANGEWRKQAIKTDANFRGLSVVNDKVAWVGGSKGTYGRTTDAGETWSAGVVRGAEKLEFRSVAAFGERTAYLLSIGAGEESRIYKTADGGATWALQFTNDEPTAFYNAVAFWDENNGLAFSDPVKGKFLLVATDDGGKNWKRLPDKGMPKALPNEGAFAASGTCLVTRGKNDAWFCTGGAKTARVFHSGDRGRSWAAYDTPVAAGVESAGIFSIAFRDGKHGVIVGGDHAKPKEAGGVTAAVTADGGKTWKAVEKRPPFRSCVARVKDRWVAVGTSGSDESTDDGATWKRINVENFNSVGFAATGAGWAVGPKGRIARVEN